MTDTIVAHELVKTYGDVRALDSLSLSVPEGTVLGLLGPNGAWLALILAIFVPLSVRQYKKASSR